MPDFDGRVDVLIVKYLQRTLSEEEQEELNKWIAESESNRRLFTKLTDEEHIAGQLQKIYSFDEEKGWRVVCEALSPVDQPVDGLKEKGNTRRISYWITVAAAAVLILFVARIYFFVPREKLITQPGPLRVAKESNTNDVLPGSNKAILTLANGAEVALNDLGNGSIALEGNSTVVKSDGKLVYERVQAGSQRLQYNSVATPRGGQYQVLLPDGTTVWLNAASSIRFPTSFPSSERRVEITGEAYFEVASNKLSPFVVAVDEAEVHVTGTHFNVMAYQEEPAVKTTLLEGSVWFQKGSSHVRLKPGQQSQLVAGGQINISDKMDAGEVLGWRNGFFYYRNADVKTVMRQIARWYNVEVEYRNNGSGDLLHVDISRDTKLSEVLKALQIAGDLRFKIEGQKIIVI